MDYYDRFESDLNDQHDYNVCMATCPDGKDCGCGGQGDPSPQAILAVVIGLIIWPGILIWGNWVIKLVDNIKDKRAEKKQRKQNGRKRKQ